MALTPDEIVNKSFKTTKFSEGYDQDEVDDFLDEVVGEFRRLSGENETLKARIAELEGELERAQADAAAAPAQVDTVDAEVIEVAPIPAAPAQPVAPPPPVQARADDEDADDEGVEALSLLSNARAVAQNTIAEGKARRDKLVSDAEAKVAELTTQAEERHAASLRDYEEKKSSIEAKIDELKTFERDYRLKLRGYIESQLRDLDRSSSLAFGGQNANN